MAVKQDLARISQNFQLLSTLNPDDHIRRRVLEQDLSQAFSSLSVTLGTALIDAGAPAADVS